MPISKRKSDNLVETSLTGKIVEDIKVDSKSKEPNLKPKNEKEVIDTNKKPTFLSTTLAELKLVNWPSFRYTYSWALVIILFTAGMSVSLGFFDHVFTNSFKFVNCSSQQGRKQPLDACGKEFFNEIFTIKR